MSKLSRRSFLGLLGAGALASTVPLPLTDQSPGPSASLDTAWAKVSGPHVQCLPDIREILCANPLKDQIDEVDREFLELVRRGGYDLLSTEFEPSTYEVSCVQA